MKPCRLDDQHVAGEVAQGSFGCGTDEQSLQRVPRHGTHYDDESIHFPVECAVLPVCEPGNEVCVIWGHVVVRGAFVIVLRGLLLPYLYDLNELLRTPAV